MKAVRAPRATRARRETLACALVAIAATAGAGALMRIGTDSDAFAAEPLRVILPVGPGAGVDNIVRTAQPALSKAFGGRPIVIENMPGAGGIVGTSAIVRAAPNGNTVGVVSNNHAVNPGIYRKMAFDSLKDITPISVLGDTAFVFVVNPRRVPATDAKSLQQFLKDRPDEFTHASSGNGTIIHLANEIVLDALQVKARHVPYKSTGAQVTDLIGGQVDMGVVSVPAAAAQLQAGALRAIGVLGSERAPSLPKVPTFAEQGFAEVDVTGWFAVIGPAGLKAEQVAAIHDAFAKAFEDAAVREALARQDTRTHPGTSEDAKTFFASEIRRYGRISEKAGVRID